MATYDVIIVGAGPAGLSAAMKAADAQLKYLLIERGRLANTLDYYYQKGKFVMALPAHIPLRDEALLPFRAGSREQVLQKWKNQANQQPLTHCHEVVTRITKKNDIFEVTTEKQVYTTKNVVVAIGKKGNPNKLKVPGEELEHVWDRLDDPQEVTDKEVLVVGGGDAAAEVALALAEQNLVTMSYRGDTFDPKRMNESLRGKLQGKVARGDMQILFNSTVTRIAAQGEGMIEVMLTVAKAESRRLEVNEVFLMLGAQIPANFLQACGVTFSADPEKDPKALPLIDDTYQAQAVKGLYIIGSLTGKDLIKPAMNQGWEVIEHIQGRPVAPIAQETLRERLQVMGDASGASVEDKVETIRRQVPLWRDAPIALLRELLLVSTVHKKHSGKVLFEKGDYSTTFFTIVEGCVDIQVSPEQIVQRIAGEFVGEMSLLSDVPRSATVTAASDPCIVIETPRRALLTLMEAVPAVKQALDTAWIQRALHMYLAPALDYTQFERLAARSELKTFNKDDILMQEGDPGHDMFIIRSGVVKISIKGAASAETVITHRTVGDYIGEMALLGADQYRSATATAVSKTEVLGITKDNFVAFVQADPQLKAAIEQQMANRRLETAVARESPQSTALLAHFIQQRVVESTDVLLIDETKCIHCDNCVTACAATHHGQSRLDRKHGPSFAHVHVPAACRHCVAAPCLLDCPPGDAIVRNNATGRIQINQAKCIGCKNCAEYCPYGVIRMVEPPSPPPKFWASLPFVRRTRREEQSAAAANVPGGDVKTGCEVCDGYAYEETTGHMTKAIKCDRCEGDDFTGEPACVKSCPTGAAIRVSAAGLRSIDFQ